MATIKLKKSSVAGRIPNASDLAYGEVALNFADGKIYYKNSSNDIKGFVDSDGVQSAITGALANLTTSDIPEGSNLYYTNARFDSALGSSSSISSIRGYFSAAGDLSYNSSTGEFSFDVENVYTQSNFDSDFNTSLDAAALGGTGLTYVGTTNTLNITNTGVVGQGYGDSSRIPVFTVNDQGQLTYAKEVRYPGVSSLGYDSATGQVTIGTIDSQTFAATVTLDPFTTTDLTEGTNLYYTRARWDSALTDVLPGNTGLQFTGGNLGLKPTNVTAATYGSASQIPVLSIDQYGRIDSAGTIAVAGVSSTSFDSAGFTFSVNTADGGTYSEMIHTKMPGTAGTYGSASQVPIITVNEFGHVDSVSTTSVAGVSSTAFDSASFNFSINTADGGTYTDMVHTKMPGTAGTYGSASQVPVITVNEFGHVDSVSTTSVAGVSSTSWDSASGVLTINTSDGASYSERILEQELGPNDNVAFKSVQMYVGDSHLPYSEGLVWYDELHKTINYYSDDSNVVHELGIEEHQRVYNNTGSTILKGQPLYFSGNYIDPNGTGVPTVGKADATDVNAYNAQGLAASDIADGEYGFCIIAGQLHDVDTSHLNAGTNFFVGLGAGLTQNASPTYPNYPMCLGWVVRADSSEGILLVNQQNHSVNSFRVRTSAHIGTDLQVDGNLTVLGSQVIASSENISIGGAFNYLNAGDTIGEANTSFVGSGLDDAFFAGHYNGDSASKQFYVKIDATGSPDTFEWGHDSASPIATGVAITGDEQDLTLGIKINFGTTTGHTSGDKWTGSASPTNVDTGWVSNRNTGTSGIGYTHLGVFYDVTDNAFKFFDRYDPEPSGTINTADSTFALATISAGTFDGNLAWSNITNKPDPTVTFNMTGEVTGTGSTTLTDLASGTISVTSTIDPTLDLTLQSLSVTDLTVTGTQTITNTETLSTGAANIFLNDSQISEPDMGLFVGYNDSYWGGIFRDATDNKWKIFNDYTPNLESSGTVDISDSSFTLATLQVGTLQGDLDWSYIQNKPDPQVTVTLTGEVTGSGTGTLTDLGNGTVSLATSIDPNADVVLNNLDITGDLNVYGTTTTVEQTNLAVSDSKIFLADKNPSDAIDVALLFEYNDGVDSQHSGLFRDASDGKFKFFKTYTDSIGNTINIADSSFALATVVADRFEGDFVGDITGSYAGFDSDFAAKSTTDLTEGTNLYYTQARVDSDITALVDSSFVSSLQAATEINALSDGFYDSATGVMSLGHKAVGQINADITCNGRFNVGVGPFVLTSILRCCTGSSGSCNTAMGYQANACGALAWGNTMIGYKAGCCNTNYFNTNIGACAGAEATSAYNTFVGAFAGQCATNGWNTAIGPYALGNGDGGLNNTVVGYFSGRNISTGCCNNFFGCCSGLCNTSGSFNVAMGNRALFSNTTGSANVAIGNNAMLSSTYNEASVAIGFCTATNSTTICKNTTLGAYTGQCALSLNQNTLIGYSAARCGALCSTVVGMCAGWSFGGTHNVIIGNCAAYAGTSSTCNNVVIGNNAAQCGEGLKCTVAIGSGALAQQVTSTRNVAIGYSAMWGMINSACDETAVGCGALTSNNSTQGCNTAIGSGALACHTNTSQQTAVGARAMMFGTAGIQNTAIGYNALTCVSGSCNTAVGYGVGANLTTGCNNTLVGRYAGYFSTIAIENTYIGKSAGVYTTSGSCNVVVGSCAAAQLTAGICNTAVGQSSLCSITTGTCNTAVGQSSLCSITTAASNVAVGAQALECNTNPNYSVAVGPQAMMCTSGGLWNIAIGQSALHKSTNGCRNIAVGAYTALANTTGCCNVMIGHNAGRNNTTGQCNTVVGESALYGSGGSCNTVMGIQTLFNNTTGNGHATLGYFTGYSNTTGTCNVAVGFCALRFGSTTRYSVALGACSMIGTNGDFNVGIGFETFCATGGTGGRNVGVGAWSTTAITNGYYNVGIGICSNKNVTCGYGNTALGTWTLTGNTTGCYNTAAGFQSMISHSGTYNVAAGYQSMQNSGEGSCNVALGTRAGTCISTGFANTIMGYHAFDKATAASNNVVIGDSAGTILLDSNDNNNVIIGSCALSNSAYLDSASLDIVNNVVIGAFAGRCMAKGCNVAIGYSAYSNNVTGCRSTVVGFGAMTCATTGRDNVAIGYKALDQWTGECNTAIGANSMRFSAETGTVMGICNTALGSGAAYCMQDGCRNTFIGSNSGWIASSRGGAYANTFIGGGSGWRVNGDFNAGIGWEAGLNLDSGECNTLLGTTAGYGLTTGSLNTFAGAFTGCNITTGTNNILIGANVGRSVGSFALDLDSATSNAIVIGNNGSKSFDIYNLSFNIDSNGETNAVDFNTTSDLSLKDNIEAINNGIDIVNKINPVSFNWKSSGKKAYGVIAQEIEEVIPEIVSKNSKGNKTVSYSQIIAFLVDAVKQQQKDIEELKLKIK